MLGTGEVALMPALAALGSTWYHSIVCPCADTSAVQNHGQPLEAPSITASPALMPIPVPFKTMGKHCHTAQASQCFKAFKQKKTHGHLCLKSSVVLGLARQGLWVHVQETSTPHSKPCKNASLWNLSTRNRFTNSPSIPPLHLGNSACGKAAIAVPLLRRRAATGFCGWLVADFWFGIGQDGKADVGDDAPIHRYRYLNCRKRCCFLTTYPCFKSLEPLCPLMVRDFE